MTVALTIAGSDPTGGAGLELDLRVFQQLGLHGMALATALTVQDSRRVHRHEVVDAELFAERLRVLLADIRPDVIKFGMLATAPIIVAVLEQLAAADDLPPLVLDPVLISSSGHALLDPEGRETLVNRLLPLVQVLCPNRVEAELILGRNLPAEQLALALADLGPPVICLTGGDADELSARDYVVINGELSVLEASRHPGPSPHGTGCAFASAVASYLALGHEPRDAVASAKSFVHAAIGAAELLNGAQGRPFLRFGEAR